MSKIGRKPAFKDQKTGMGEKNYTMRVPAKIYEQVQKLAKDRGIKIIEASYMLWGQVSQEPDEIPITQIEYEQVKQRNVHLKKENTHLTEDNAVLKKVAEESEAAKERERLVFIAATEALVEKKGGFYHNNQSNDEKHSQIALKLEGLEKKLETEKILARNAVELRGEAVRDLKKAENELDTAREGIQELKSELKECRDSYEGKIHEMVQDYECALEQAEQQCKGANKELDIQVDALISENVVLEGNLEAIQGELKMKTHDLQGERLLSTSLRKELNKAESELHKLRKEIKDAEEELAKTIDNMEIMVECDIGELNNEGLTYIEKLEESNKIQQQTVIGNINTHFAAEGKLKAQIIHQEQIILGYDICFDLNKGAVKNKDVVFLTQENASLISEMSLYSELADEIWPKAKKGRGLSWDKSKCLLEKLGYVD